MTTSTVHTVTEVPARHSMYESTAEFNACEAVAVLVQKALEGRDMTCPADGFDAPRVHVSSGGRSVTVNWPYGTSDSGRELLMSLHVSHAKPRGIYYASAQFHTVKDGIVSMLVASHDHVLGSSMLGHEAAARFNRKKFVAFATRIIDAVVAGDNGAFNERVARADEALHNEFARQ